MVGSLEWLAIPGRLGRWRASFIHAPEPRSSLGTGLSTGKGGSPSTLFRGVRNRENHLSVKGYSLMVQGELILNGFCGVPTWIENIWFCKCADDHAQVLSLLQSCPYYYNMVVLSPMFLNSILFEGGGWCFVIILSHTPVAPNLRNLLTIPLIRHL